MTAVSELKNSKRRRRKERREAMPGRRGSEGGIELLVELLFGVEMLVHRNETSEGS